MPRTFGDLDTLCNFVETRLSSRPYSYVYQEIILYHAGVDQSDSKELRNAKVQTLWTRDLMARVCHAASFTVPNGSLLKFAVHQKFDSFIVDVTRNWRVDLNHIGTSDGRTVLDYVSDEMIKEHARSSSSVGILKTYFTLLRTAGGKHRRELP